MKQDLQRPGMEDLPGWEIVSHGLTEAETGQITTGSCLVWIALPRLFRAGLISPAVLAHPINDPELTLYRLLRLHDGDAYSRYNALLRRLVSFEHSLDRMREDFGR